MNVTYRRLDDIGGYPQYAVIVDGVEVGRVWRRRGGWWAGRGGERGIGTSWGSSRKDATRSVLRGAGLTETVA